MKRIGNFSLLLMLFFVSAIINCGGSSSDHPTLSEDMVLYIVSGNATGSSYSGNYNLTISVTESECYGMPGLVEYGTTADVIQSDGKVDMNLSQASVTSLSGSINSDGSFKVGGKEDHFGEVVELVLAQGKISGATIDSVLYLTFITSSETCNGKGKVTGNKL